MALHFTRRIIRRSQDRVVLGVAGGVADAIGLEPTVVRAGFVALALAGGIGAVVYLALAALLPIGGGDQRPDHDGAVLDETASGLWVGGLAGMALIGGGIALLAVQMDWPVWVAPAVVGAAIGCAALVNLYARLLR